MRQKYGFFVLIIAVLLFSMVNSPNAKTWYVDDDNPCPGTGTIGDPFCEIQPAIDAASDTDTVLVADGTYTGLANRDLDFLGKAISVQSENGPENCIIDCEYYAGGFIFQSDEGQDSVVSGFTITKCKHSHHAIMCWVNASPTITNCIITGNAGGGIWGSVNSSPPITDCSITDNGRTGIFTGNGGATITDCSITGNDEEGIVCGGITTITNCSITDNGSSGIWSLDSSSVTIRNCLVTGNGGSGIDCANSSPTITDCSITGNGYRGIDCGNSSPTITNCIITGNAGGGIGCYNNSCPTVTSCSITDNGGSGIMYSHNFDCSSTVTNCSITGNTAEYGAGISVVDASPTITNSTITGNTAEYGAGVDLLNSSATIANCTITNNTAGLVGGGIGCIGCFEGYSPTIMNCTISNNTASLVGGGIGLVDSFPTLTNCILWGDSPDEIYVASGDIAVTYSDVEGGWEGTGNIDADPLFVGGGDYHLTASSPCIDAGTSVGAPAHDIEGDPRPQDGGYDMGSDEYAIADIKANGSDGPVFVTPPDPVELTISLDPGGMAGEVCDWWFVILILNPPVGPVLVPIGQIPLFNLPETPLFNVPLPLGIYGFLFILDDVPDGSFGVTWYDYVIVACLPQGVEMEIPSDFEALFRERIDELIGE